MPIEVVFGTRNRGKVRELRRLLQRYDIVVHSLHDHPDDPDADDDGDTFAANAVKNARHVGEALGCLGLADDSGLVVDALDGRPGIHSARYGGEGLPQPEKNALLLSELKGVPDERRTARFICVLAAVPVGGGEPLLAEGKCEGRILHEPRGDGGFGYDPLFGVDERPGKAMAELEADDKNRISHRGRAMRGLLPGLLGLLGVEGG